MSADAPISRRAVLACVAGLVWLAILAAAPAAADTVYLKNGRVIHTVKAEVEKDQLVFYQFGNRIVIPMALVERIEKDERRGPEAAPVPPQPAAGQEGEAEAGEGEAGEAETEGEAGEEGSEQPDPRETREYWQNEVRSILEEERLIEERLEELHREERAFLFSHRSTASTRRQIEEAEGRLEELDQEMSALREEARRMGIPPGWLRVRLEQTGRDTSDQLERR